MDHEKRRNYDTVKILSRENKLVIKMIIWGVFYVLALLQKTSHILGYLTLTIPMRCVLWHQFILGEAEVQKV